MNFTNYYDPDPETMQFKYDGAKEKFTDTLKNKGILSSFYDEITDELSSIFSELKTSNVEKLYNVKVILDNENEPVKYYGKYKNLGIRRYIGRYKKYPLPPQWKKEFEKVKNYVKAKNYDYALDLLKNLRDILNDKVYQDFVDETIMRVKTHLFQTETMGEFYADDFKIVLYLKNISKAANEAKKDFQEELIRTYFHEFFHAYHYLAVKEKFGIWASGYHFDIIKESFAKYAEYCFMSSRPYAYNDILKPLEKNPMDIFPYSGALIVHKALDNQLLCDKINLVFEDSLKNMETAYNDLITCQNIIEDSSEFIKSII